MTKKFITAISFIAVIVIGMLGCLSKYKQTEEFVKVGVLLPLTGDLAQYGIAIKNGIDLAYSESSIKNKIQLVYEDEKGEPRTAITIVKKYLSKDKVDVLIGGATSAIAASIIPITSKDKKVLISPYATASALFGEDNYFYSLQPSDNYEGLFIADYVVTQKIDAIGVLYINDNYGVGISTSFTDGLKEKNTQPLFTEGYIGGETNFKTQINKMKSLGVKVVYLPGYYTEVSLILQQMKELGCDFKIIGSSNFYDTRFLKQSYAEGVVFCYLVLEKDSSDMYKTFVDSYSVKYNQQPDAFAIQGYNSFKFVEKIVLDNASNAKIDFQDVIKKVKKFQGVNSIINFSVDGSAINNLNMMEIRGGHFININ